MVDVAALKEAIKEHKEEIVVLVREGDVNLDQYREVYNEHWGRHSKMTDDQLIEYIATELDDMDDPDRAIAMHDFEQGYLGIV